MRRALVFLLAAACGSKSPPAKTIGNTAGSQSSQQTAIPSGDYTCRFSSGGYTFDPYRCQVGEGATPSIAKVGGFERFTGTLAPSGHDVVIHATAACNDVKGEPCPRFDGTLKQEDNGLWKGTLTGPKDWWLSGGELELSYDPDGSGLGYGGYGGYDYGD